MLSVSVPTCSGGSKPKSFLEIQLEQEGDAPKETSGGGGSGGGAVSRPLKGKVQEMMKVEIFTDPDQRIHPSKCFRALHTNITHMYHRVPTHTHTHTRAHTHALTHTHRRHLPGVQ